MPKIQDYTNIGAIATGDKLLGERVDGTTVRMTYAQPSMSGTTNRITVTAGVDSFTFNISTSYVGQSSITTLGTITTGVWNGITIAVANGGTGTTTSTGTGSVVLNNGPTFIAPVLGTPAGGDLSNCTNYPLAQLTGAATGVLTFLATPSSANLRAALTDETGTGAAYFQGGDLGTPSAGVLSNCTGLSVAGGGSGRSSTTPYAVICGGTTSTSAEQSIASVGASGEVLTSNGAGALPTFQAVPFGTEVTQTQQEAGTNTTSYVSADKMKYAPGVCKTWVRFDASSGTPTISASLNVSSITDNGVGDYTINFTTSFSAATYCAVATVGTNSNILGVGQPRVTNTGAAPATGSFRLHAGYPNSASTNFMTAIDVAYASVAFYGDF